MHTLKKHIFSSTMEEISPDFMPKNGPKWPKMAPKWPQMAVFGQKSIVFSPDFTFFIQ